MNPPRLYLDFINAGSLAATIILSLYGAEYIDDATFHPLYSPFAWACYHLPFFVTQHERWIERFGTVRDLWRQWRDAE